MQIRRPVAVTRCILDMELAWTILPSWLGSSSLDCCCYAEANARCAPAPKRQKSRPPKTRPVSPSNKIRTTSPTNGACFALGRFAIYYGGYERRFSIHRPVDEGTRRVGDAVGAGSCRSLRQQRGRRFVCLVRGRVGQSGGPCCCGARPDKCTRRSGGGSFRGRPDCRNARTHSRSNCRSDGNSGS